ncbi:MAG: ISKra4 family transposase [Caldilineaceae bacterium]|nr:ISKra4 family transposase [Caldilineaceae bacterium]
MRIVLRVAQVFSPLDEELELLAGEYTPHAMENLVRLSAWMPFGRAVETLAGLLRVQVSKSSAVRMTEAAGAAYVSWQDEVVADLERRAPLPPEGADQAVISADGAMVPLLHGQWGEVKTLVIGEVAKSKKAEGKSHNLTYFSRLASAEEFTRTALFETHRRGLESSAQVAAVMDGAEWLQSFADHHCPQALRILDFPHAGQRITAIAQALWGETETASTWSRTWLHRLKTKGAQPLIEEVRLLLKDHPDCEPLRIHLAYLEKRQSHMDYPAFVKAGWPIGSGCVESANKVVVEARLKGAGMHWHRRNVNPLLALRNVVCNEQWDEAWAIIEDRLRTAARQHRRLQQQKRHLARQQQRAAANPLPLPLPTALSTVEADKLSPSLPAAHPQSSSNRPAPDHPWRRFRFGRNRYSPHKNAKT